MERIAAEKLALTIASPRIDSNARSPNHHTHFARSTGTETDPPRETPRPPGVPALLTSPTQPTMREPSIPSARARDRSPEPKSTKGSLMVVPTHGRGTSPSRGASPSSRTRFMSLGAVTSASLTQKSPQRVRPTPASPAAPKLVSRISTRLDVPGRPNSILPDSQFICSLCNGPYRTPKVLSCGHAFCLACLEPLQTESIVPCSVCNKICALPESGLRGLMTDTEKEMRVQGVSRLIPAHPNCDTCDSPTPATMCCIDCAKLLCAVHHEAHSLARATKTHKCQTVAHMQRAKQPLYRRASRAACPEHRTLELRYYCETCEKLICKECTKTSHSGSHNYMYLMQAGERDRVAVEKLVKEAQTQIPNLEEGIATATGLVNQLDKSAAETSAEIRQQIQALQSILRDRERQLLAEVEAVKEQKKRTLAAQREALEVALAAAKASAEYGTKSLNGSDAEVVSIKATLVRKMKEISSVWKDAEPQIDEHIGFFYQDTAANALERFGVVESVLVDPAQCEASGPGLTSASVARRTSFMIFVRDGKGRLARHRRIKVRVHGPTGDVDSRLSELPTGAYEASFTPVASGDHEISIQVQGKHVQRSPFRLCVRESRALTDIGLTPPLLSFGRDQLLSPTGIAVDVDGNFLVLNRAPSFLALYDPQGRFLGKLETEGMPEGQFRYPCKLAMDPSVPNQFAVCDYGNHRIQVFDGDGQFVRSFGGYGDAPGRVAYPLSVTITKTGQYACVDRDNHCVHVFDEFGEFKMRFGGHGTGDGELFQPTDIVVTKKGQFIVADCWNHRIQVFGKDGAFLFKFGKDGEGDGEFSLPEGVAVDKDGNIYVSDTQNHRVQVFTKRGVFLHKFGTKGDGPRQFVRPSRLLFTKEGRLAVIDFDNRRIQVF